MHVDVIERWQGFEALRGEWEALYDADPHAQVFLSWNWMSTWLERGTGPDGRNTGDWVILVARQSADATECAAILPLRYRPDEAGSGPRLAMAGRRFADHAGVLCRPEAREAAIPALARSVKLLRWQRWQIECLSAPPEVVRLLLAGFPQTAFAVAETRSMNRGEETDNSICPYIDLPENFEAYLSAKLSANSRQKLRRLLRVVDGSDEFAITHATDGTIERDIKILLQLWKNKWQEKKRASLQAILQLNATVIGRNFRNGQVYLPVLWQGTRPLGALAFFVDERKKAMHFSIAGRDERFEQSSPGLVLHAHSIRHAISCGMQTYDFLRGNEPYKYSFGAAERRIRSLVITRRARVS